MKKTLYDNMNKKDMVRKENGITLIALVIV